MDPTSSSSAMIPPVLGYTDEPNFEDAPDPLHIPPAPRRDIQHTPPPLSNTATPAFLTPNAFTSSSDFLYPDPATSSHSSVCSTAVTTPMHSRPASPSPLFYSFIASHYSSETDSEPSSPSLTPSQGRQWWREESQRRRWWAMGNTIPARRRRRGSYGCGFRSFKRLMRSFVRRRFVPKQPLMICLTLLLLSIFGICLTFLIIHILNPDKEPLPWRYYCSIPSTSTTPPLPTEPFTLIPDYTSLNLSQLPPPFPPPDLDMLPSVGLFLGVFSLDNAIERRMMIRSTWASHKKSREGNGIGDGGIGTSRTIVRFILGQPTREWDRRVRLEMEAYNDIVILPVYENMNAGKSHAYFTWAASNAWVPPHYQSSPNSVSFSYSNTTSPIPPLAEHDPIQARKDAMSEPAKSWVRPDFVVKADDDCFVMLAELESRLRVQLYDEIREPKHISYSDPRSSSSVISHTSETVLRPTEPTNRFNEHVLDSHTLPAVVEQDPLIYWGYLVKNRFMAGELYALSWALVDWVANDSSVKTMIKGAEDKQTAKWIMSYPQPDQVRWASERCWIYDHPRAGTVYSHGFLFPSEVTRVKELLLPSLEAASNKLFRRASATTQSVFDLGTINTPDAWAHSSVSTFGVRYSSPLQDMTTWQSVEALIEGSNMSKLREDSPMTADYAWDHREGRISKYEGQRVGGTIVVHFIKKNMWFMETALTLLEMEDVTELEKKTLKDSEHVRRCTDCTST